jgi:regulatory protein
MSVITAIEEQKNNKNRVNIYVDHDFFMGASKYAAEKNKLKVGQTVEKETLEKVVYEDSLEKAKEYFIKYLMNKTEKEIIERLKIKGYDEKIAIDIIDFRNRYNISNDKEIAGKIAKDAVKLNKQGKNKVRQTLKLKGVNSQEIEEVLNDIDENDEVEAAIVNLQRKLTTYEKKSNSPYELRGRCYKYLISRGYSSDVIERVLYELKIQ